MSGNTLIRFGNRQDEAKAVAGLGDRFRVHRLKGRIYSVPSEGVIWLNEAGIPYAQATDEEVEAASGPIRHPVAAAVLTTEHRSQTSSYWKPMMS